MHSTSEVDTRTAVLMGAGQLTNTETPPESARSLTELLSAAARLAENNGGLTRLKLAGLDAIAVLRLPDNADMLADLERNEGVGRSCAERRLRCTGCLFVAVQAHDSKIGLVLFARIHCKNFFPLS